MTGAGLRAAALAAALLAPDAGRAAECRLALALGLDISSSVNASEYALQIEGLAAALRAPDIREALLAQGGEVRLAAFEWSGQRQQDLLFGWTPIRAEADIEALAARLDAHRRPHDTLSTSVGRALRFAAGLLGAPEAAGCARRVLDLSGDGEQNEGETPAEARAAGLLEGLTVNALVIDGEWPSPVGFYAREVIGGDGAFMMVARGGFEDYPEMIRRKLLREIAPPVLVGERR